MASRLTRPGLSVREGKIIGNRENIMREARAEQRENNNSQVIQRIGSWGRRREEERLTSDDNICFPRHFWSFCIYMIFGNWYPQTSKDWCLKEHATVVSIYGPLVDLSIWFLETLLLILLNLILILWPFYWVAIDILNCGYWLDIFNIDIVLVKCLKSTCFLAVIYMYDVFR